MRRARRTKEYENYRRKFYDQKKEGNIKQGVRVLTINQYKRARKESLNDTKILKAQTILHSKKEKREIWSQYKRIRKSYKRGETLDQEGTYFGETYESEEGLAYHYNLSGLMKDKDALHFMISFRIAEGEERKEVLADYGY
jgi:hypothetical protein